jgi:hypothetical protein
LTGEALTALAPDGSFVEPTVFHVLATQTLEPSKLRALDTQIESARFRANVEIGTDPHEPAALQDAWVGGVLRVGADVSMKIQMATMRGELTTLPNDLAVDPRVLRSLVLANLVELPGQFPSIGAYASLARDLSGGGWIRRGDPCLLDRS